MSNTFEEAVTALMEQRADAIEKAITKFGITEEDLIAGNYDVTIDSNGNTEIVHLFRVTRVPLAQIVIRYGVEVAVDDEEEEDKPTLVSIEDAN